MTHVFNIGTYPHYITVDELRGDIYIALMTPSSIHSSTSSVLKFTHTLYSACQPEQT